MSCCNCLSIRVDGEYLDLPENFALETYKRREDTTRIGTSGNLLAVEASIPATSKNKSLAGDILNPGTVSPTYRPKPCVVKENGETLEFSQIQFSGAEDQADTISFTLFQGEKHWIDQAAATQLPDIDELGSYTFTKSFLDSNHQNDAQYADGDLGVWFPLVNYGRFLRGRDINWNEDNNPDQAPVEFSESQVTVEDFRPLFHVLSVLQKGFCHIGWNFVCPILETPTGRRIGAYLLDEKLGTDPDFLATAKFEATLSEYNDITSGFFDTEVLDGANNFENGRFSRAGVHDLTIVLRGTQSVFEDREGVEPGTKLFVYKYEADGTVSEVLLEVPINGRSFNDLFSLEGIELVQGQYIKAYIEVRGVRVQIDEARFYNKPKKVIITRGTEVNIPDIIGNYNFLDFIKGVAHLINGRTVTDKINNTVYLYAPTDVEFYGDNTEGFRDSTYEDWTDKITPDSRSVVWENSTVQRFQKFAFQNSNDPAIDALNLEDGTDYLERLVDLGTEFQGGTNEDRNPFFEPTVNEQMTVFFPDYITDGNANMRPYVPQMLDNDQLKLSFDIGPRLVYFAGMVTQENEAGTKSSYWRYENATAQAIPYAYQVPNEDVFISGQRPSVRLAYGNYEGLDFYDLFYRDDLLSRLLTPRHSYQIKLSGKQYREENFRKPKRIFYNDRTYLATLEEIPSRLTCSSGSLQVIVRPDAFVGDYCGTGTVGETTPINQPRIDITIDFDGGLIRAEADNGQITSTIDTDSWEYSTDDGETYTSYTPGTDLSGESRVIFKRSVTFTDSTPEKVVTKVADFTSLCSNTPGLSVSFDEITGEVLATKTGEFNSTIDTDSLFVTVDGGTETSYTEGNTITGFSSVVFRRVVTYTNACPDSEVTASFDATVQPCQNSPAIVYTEVATGVYDISIGGTTQSVIAYSDIQVSYDNGATWSVWDRAPVIPSGTFKTRAIIHYTDDCKSQTIEAGCPS